MKNKWILLALLGGGLGVTLSTVIALIISAIIGDGQFYPVVPSLAEQYGPFSAVLLQTVVSFLYGAMWAMASLIWQTHWSILRQTLTHFLLCTSVTLPVVYLLHWAHPSLWGALSYLIIFVAIYGAIWLIQYLSMRASIRKMNQKMKQGW